MHETTGDQDLVQREYLIRRKVLTILGAKFHVYDPGGQLLLFTQQKAFKLKEDIRVYADESMAEERLLIRARQVVDFSAAYDVIDATAQTKVGALRRRGFQSMVRDSWEFLDPEDRPLATLQEDSMALAFVRRFLSNLIPQSYHAVSDGRTLATYKQRFNPFILKLDVRVEPGGEQVIDPRLALGAGILLAAVEGRQR